MIKTIPYHLRPREKARRQGVEKLTDIELLALFIRNGTPNHNAIAIAKQVFERYYDFYTLQNASLQEIESFKGLGPIKALEIKALFEVFIRIEKGSNHHLVLANYHEAIEFAFPHLGRALHELFFIIYLNHKHEIIYYKVFYHGTENAVNIDPKEIFTVGLQVKATQFYCFHNHPSGHVRPSKADIIMTQRIRQYAKILNIKMLYHIILTNDRKFFLI